MKKATKIIIASIAVIAVSGSVFAFGARHHFANMSVDEKVDMVNYRISRKLDLDEIQQQKLGNLSSRVAQIVMQARMPRQERQVWIDQLIDEGPLDQAALLGKVSERTQLVDQYAPEIIALLGEFVDGLSLEQKQELKEMMSRRGGHYRGQGWKGNTSGDSDL